MNKRLLTALLSVMALAGCERTPTLEQFGGQTMGSTYSVKYVADANTPSVEALKTQTERYLAEVDQLFSTYREDSVVAEFNALPAGQCLTVAPAVRQMVEAAAQLSELSNGAFDVTVAPLLKLWGFGPHQHALNVPSAEAIDKARALVGYQHVRVEADQLCKDAAVILDFNSIVAGYAVDQVLAQLKAAGVTSMLVEITGELKAVGKKPDGSAWRIAIEAPRTDAQIAQRIVELDGLGVSTSGDYRNYFEQDGKRYSHTLDPSLGTPIKHALASVTVVDALTLQADGLSTLLMVLGPDEGLAFAELNGIAAFFVVHSEQGFSTFASSMFKRRFGDGENQ